MPGVVYEPGNAEDPGMLRDDIERSHIAMATIACFAAAGLYRWIGFLGVALFGMIIVFLAASVDLDDWRGTAMHGNLYQQRLVDDQRYTRNEREAWKRERTRRWRASDYAMMVGLAFLAVGGAGFLIFR
jgi:hypothetical protein